MKAILYGTSALEALRCARLGRRSCKAAPFRRPPHGCACSLEQIERFGFVAHGTGSKPIHVLVSEGNRAHSSGDLVVHASGLEYPDGSFLQAGDGLYCSAPELCFVQLGAMFDDLRLIEVGYELCSSYTFDATGHLRSDIPPATTPETLLGYFDRGPPAPGIKRARRAGARIRSGAASPMEAIVSMLLTLPNRLGGRALPGCELNKRIKLTPEAAAVYGRKSCVCDLFWPGLDVEYNGRAFHEGRMREDERRRNALATMGIATLTLWADQVYDLDTFNRIADGIGARLRKDPRVRVSNFRERQLALHALLPR